MPMPIHAVFLHLLIWLFLSTFRPSIGIESDIYCLKSIKDSLQDPHNYLSSWVFTNLKEEGFICSFIGIECWHPSENRVLNVRLSEMGLNGQFPQGLQNCTSLTGLDLSYNNLEGPIPFDISKIIPYVTTLDLSYNNFSGEIPSNISGCSYLNVLKLDHNQLEGHIPCQIEQLERLKSFSVANNLLSELVPDLLFGEDSYANNLDLCGKPLGVCSEEMQGFEFYDSFRSGFLIGYVVFFVSIAVVFFVPLCANGWILSQRIKRSQ